MKLGNTVPKRGGKWTKDTAKNNTGKNFENSSKP